MAQEIRKIEFNMVETQAALQVFCQKTGKKLPPGQLSIVSNDTAAPTNLNMEFEGGKVLPMRDKDMMTALLLFCQEKSIPVPKGGKKLVKGEGSKVVLLLKMG